MLGQFATSVDLVEVYATVTDSTGQPVTSLTSADFRVAEDDNAQTITVFSAGDFPLSVVVALDRSFSMAGERLALAKDAARAFIEALRPDDEVMVLAIGSEIQTITPPAPARAAANGPRATTRERHMEQADDFDIVLAAAKAGAEWAWGVLFRSLAGPVTGYLASRGASDPEDLTSEAFLQIARNIHSFDGSESAFRSWVFVIAHRRLIDSRVRRGELVPVVVDGAAKLEADALVGPDVGRQYRRASDDETDNHS